MSNTNEYGSPISSNADALRGNSNQHRKSAARSINFLAAAGGYSNSPIVNKKKKNKTPMSHQSSKHVPKIPNTPSHMVAAPAAAAAKSLLSSSDSSSSSSNNNSSAENQQESSLFQDQDEIENQLNNQTIRIDELQQLVGSEPQETIAVVQQQLISAHGQRLLNCLQLMQMEFQLMGTETAAGFYAIRHQQMVNWTIIAEKDAKAVIPAANRLMKQKVSTPFNSIYDAAASPAAAAAVVAAAASTSSSSLSCNDPNPLHRICSQFEEVWQQLQLHQVVAGLTVDKSTDVNNIDITIQRIKQLQSKITEWQQQQKQQHQAAMDQTQLEKSELVQRCKELEGTSAADQLEFSSKIQQYKDQIKERNIQLNTLKQQLHQSQQELKSKMVEIPTVRNQLDANMQAERIERHEQKSQVNMNNIRSSSAPPSTPVSHQHITDAAASLAAAAAAAATTTPTAASMMSVSPVAITSSQSSNSISQAAQQSNSDNEVDLTNSFIGIPHQHQQHSDTGEESMQPEENGGGWDCESEDTFVSPGHKRSRSNSNRSSSDNSSDDGNHSSKFHRLGNSSIQSS